jgi:uncharacterized protein YbbC (DUF1343 family)
MPSVTTALLYPGLCLLEGTNLSEGRGTTRPFEVIGAPWLPARAFVAALEALGVPGLWARPHCFEPAFQKHAGRVGQGAWLEICDRRILRPVRAGLAVIAAALGVAPGEFAWRRERYEFVSDRLAIDLLVGGPAIRLALEAGAGLEELTADFAEAERAFAERARPSLLYERAGGLLAGGGGP